MSLVESMHAEHKARLARMNGPKPALPTPDAAREISALRKVVETMGAQVKALTEQLSSHAEVISKYLIKETDEKPRFSDIMDCVCVYYKVSHSDVISSRRTGELIVPRQMISYLGRHLTGMSFPQMGRRLGGRDHTTILHAADRMLQMLQKDEQLKKDHDAITTDIAVHVMKRRNERLVQ